MPGHISCPTTGATAPDPAPRRLATISRASCSSTCCATGRHWPHRLRQHQHGWLTTRRCPPGASSQHRSRASTFTSALSPSATCPPSCRRPRRPPGAEAIYAAARRALTLKAQLNLAAAPWSRPNRPGQTALLMPRGHCRPQHHRPCGAEQLPLQPPRRQSAHRHRRKLNSSSVRSGPGGFRRRVAGAASRSSTCSTPRAPRLQEAAARCDAVFVNICVTPMSTMAPPASRSTASARGAGALFTEHPHRLLHQLRQPLPALRVAALPNLLAAWRRQVSQRRRAPGSTSCRARRPARHPAAHHRAPLRPLLVVPTSVGRRRLPCLDFSRSAPTSP